MADANNKPVIFLAFANDRDDSVAYLRNLPDEARRLREVLQPAEQANLCEVVVRSNSTASDIFKVFQDSKYRNRIAIFHYGGHANGYQLLLESALGQAAAADAGGLAMFLAQQQSLHLVFLNGCSTQQQTQGLLDARVSAVISTSRAIDDQVATDFACQFYQGLAGGASIRIAYNESEAAQQTGTGGNTRALYFGDSDDSKSQLEADRWPWKLYLREGSEHGVQWNLPDAVGDHLFGLPALPELDLPESPYRNLYWFERKDAEVFFGRGHQIRELYDRLTAPRTPPIMLFYGQSGVGKSSILDAGLIPRLEQDYEVRYLRRTAGGLLDTLQWSFLPEAYDVPVETAWRVKEEKLGRPLIVFLDQVEELYTRPIVNVPNELDQLLRAVKATFVESAQRPRGKLVFCFRKEWLAEIEAHMVDFELPRTKVFLEPLDRRGIIDVVQGPAQSERLRQCYGLTVEDGLAEIIAEDLLADRGSAIAPTLQILLTKMWTKATEDNYENPRFTQELYLQLKRDGILLRDFLNQQIAAFRQRHPDAVDSGLLLDIVARHTTSLGTADQRTIEQLQKEYSHLGDTLPYLLQQCEDLHLLTVTASTQKEPSKTTRLVHDTLAPLVREQFEVSDKPGQRARRILDNRSVDWEADNTGTPLDEADLAVVEQGARGTHAPTPTEQRLLDASRELHARLKRIRMILKFAGTMALALIIVAAAIAVQQSLVAISARNKAHDALVTGKTAVDEMLMKVGSEDLKNVPQMEGVREELLSKASNFYAEFKKQDPGNPQWQYEIALADMHIGDMNRALGKNDESDQAYRDSTERFAELISRDSDKPEYQQGLANSYNWWGELWRRRDNEKAEEKYTKALRLQEHLVTNFASYEDHATYWYELARTHNNLGLLRRYVNDADAAICAHTLVIAMLDEEKSESALSTFDLGPYLRICHPEIDGAEEVIFARYLDLLRLDHVPRPESYRQVLAWSYGNRAIVRKYKEQYEQAAEDYKKAISLWEELLKKEPDQRDYKKELAKSNNNLANLLITSTRVADALSFNVRAVDTLKQLAAATPTIRSELANSYMSRGAMLWELSKKERGNQDALLKDAAVQFEKAYEHFRDLFGEDPGKEDYITRLGMCVCNMATLELGLQNGSKTLQAPPNGNPKLDDHDLSLARHTESAMAMEKLDVLGRRADAKRYERAAWIMSRCILLVRADENLTEQKREELAHDYAGRTLKLLQLAIDKGLDMQDLSSDKRFEPLRELLPQAIDDLTSSIVPAK